MKIHHTSYHWIMVVLILVALLLALSEAQGQSAGAAAQFQGRPALAGAQAGQGAQAGPAQGGIGVQGTESAQRSVTLGKSATPDNAPQVDERLNSAAMPADAASRNEVVPGRDHSLAKEHRSAANQSKRAAKRTYSRARHGVSPIDSTASAETR